MYASRMGDLEKHTKRIREFCEERDWGQYTNPKDVALSLVLEATEVLEHFQWISDAEVDAHSKKYKDEIAEELADTYYWVLHLCDRMGIDLAAAFQAKMTKNEAKYPADKVKGKHTNKHDHKYNKL